MRSVLLSTTWSRATLTTRAAEARAPEAVAMVPSERTRDSPEPRWRAVTVAEPTALAKEKEWGSPDRVQSLAASRWR